ncbi:MAG: SRPBCC domain-containing protein [Gammaproteobacteria bacterium]
MSNDSKNNFTIRTRILKPVAEVFKAVVSGDILTKYFSHRTSGDLVEGSRVVWFWEGYGEHPVTVQKVETDRLVVFVWDSEEWHKTGSEENFAVTVTMEFEALDDGNTMLSISESGWDTASAAGLKGSYENCGGWQHMTSCLKAYLEYGIDLR